MNEAYPQEQNENFEEVVEISKENIRNWVNTNSPDNNEELEQIFNEVNVEVSEANNYNFHSKTISLEKDTDTNTATHEFVHAISTKYLNGKEYRAGISNTSMMESVPNEAFTELVTLVISKGTKYFTDTSVEEIAKDFLNNTESSYSYQIGTVELIKVLKEHNIDEEKVNEIVKTYLFSKGTAMSIKDYIGKEIGVSNIEGEIKGRVNEVGYNIAKESWNAFIDSAESIKEEKVSIDGDMVSLSELFAPLGNIINEKKINLNWSSNSAKQKFLKNLGEHFGVEVTSLHVDTLVAISKIPDLKERRKQLDLYLIPIAVKYYKLLKKNKTQDETTL